MKCEKCGMDNHEWVSKCGRCDNPFPTASANKSIMKEVTLLFEQSMHEDWNPFASIAIECTQCNEVISLHQTDGSGFYLIYRGKEVGDPVNCPKCNSSNFLIKNTKQSFRDWLLNHVEKNPHWEHDPFKGLKDINTGSFFTDHGFRGFSSYGEAWTTIHKFVDEKSILNPTYRFEYVISRSCVKHYIGESVAVAHYNWRKNVLVLIIKDRMGRYWCAVDRDGSFIDL